ncbi:MAG TPA: hypothetical protein VEY91_08770 [Candidatus Limnocylindria bacterium]|nr:hypothetical protein [Candidatus Limnocylindria bacterium]
MTITQRAARTDKRTRSSRERWISASQEERIRWSKVLAAQARIASGYYDRDDVKAFLVEAIWQELHAH